MNHRFAFGFMLVVAYVCADDNSVESIGDGDAAGTTIRPRRHSGYGSENGVRFGNGHVGQGNGFGKGRFGSGNSFGRGQFGSDRGFGGNDKNDLFGGRGFGGNNFGGARPGSFGSEGFGGRGSGSHFGGNQGLIPAGGKQGFGQRL
ncbi:hypothetical protein AAVH_25980 [Aphelenchoides avenae]|nr:hypothetical protein AAVH_25980 [Aphelenchus avenae]